MIFKSIEIRSKVKVINYALKFECVVYIYKNIYYTFNSKNQNNYTKRKII